MVRPGDYDFRVTASPLVDIYDRERKLHRFMDEIGKHQQIADTSIEFRDLVNKGLADLEYPIPLRAVFVDGTDGTETDYPEFIRVPVLMIVPHDASGEIYPTLQ